VLQAAGDRRASKADGRLVRQRAQGARLLDLPTATPRMPCIRMPVANQQRTADYWKPDRSNMVIAGDDTGTLISIIVDSGHDEAWMNSLITVTSKP
jgi:hypothetical protein